MLSMVTWPYGGYFTRISGHLGVVSSADTLLIPKNSEKDLEKYYAFNVLDTLLWLQNGHEYSARDEDIGCLFDSYYKESDHIVRGLKSCTICDSCKRILTERKMPKEQLEAIESVLKWIGSSTSAYYRKCGVAGTMLSISLMLAILPQLALLPQ